MTLPNEMINVINTYVNNNDIKFEARIYYQTNIDEMLMPQIYLDFITESISSCERFNDYAEGSNDYDSFIKDLKRGFSSVFGNQIYLKSEYNKQLGFDHSFHIYGTKDKIWIGHSLINTKYFNLDKFIILFEKIKKYSSIFIENEIINCNTQLTIHNDAIIDLP